MAASFIIISWMDHSGLLQPCWENALLLKVIMLSLVHPFTTLNNNHNTGISLCAKIAATSRRRDCIRSMLLEVIVVLYLPQMYRTWPGMTYLSYLVYCLAEAKFYWLLFIWLTVHFFTSLLMAILLLVSLSLMIYLTQLPDLSWSTRIYLVETYTNSNNINSKDIMNLDIWIITPPLFILDKILCVLSKMIDRIPGLVTSYWLQLLSLFGFYEC